MGSLEDYRGTFRDLPAGVFEGVVDYEIRWTKGAGGATKKAMLVLKVTAVSPAEYAGIDKSDFQVIGTDYNERFGTEDDPGATKEKTWQRKGGALKDLAVACGWDLKKDIAYTQDGEFSCVPKALLEFCKGKRVMFSITQENEPQKNRDGSINERAGRVRANIGKYMKVGSLKPVVSEVQLQPIDYVGGGATAAAAVDMGAAPPAS